jgi:hypothetical protein
VVSYDGTSLPDHDGWYRNDDLFLAESWVENGWLIQYADVVDFGGLPVNQDDIYGRSIAEFAGADEFFIEWRMVTDGPREGIAHVSPAALALAGRMGITYHCTIAEDQAALRRDTLYPIVFADIEPGVPHTFRFEVFGDRFYSFLIDGEVIDSGTPEGFYPTSDSFVVFGARAADEPITAAWDYIKFGHMPEPASGACLLLGAAILLRRRRRPRRPPFAKHSR